MFVLVLSAVVFWLYFSDNVSAEANSSESFSWVDTKPVVYSSELASDINQYSRDGSYQSAGVYSIIGDRMICVKTNGTIRLGYYYESGRYYWVVSYPADSIFYRINMPCYNNGDCLFLPGSDSLVTKQYLINGIVRSLVIYKNVSQRIGLSLASVMAFRYRLIDSNPDYIFKSTSGYAWPIGGVGASDNGTWLAIELRQRV